MFGNFVAESEMFCFNLYISTFRIIFKFVNLLSLLVDTLEDMSSSCSEREQTGINSSSVFLFFLFSSVRAHFLGSLPERLWRHLLDLHLSHGETHNQQETVKKFWLINRGRIILIYTHEGSVVIIRQSVAQTVHKSSVCCRCTHCRCCVVVFRLPGTASFWFTAWVV